MNQQDYLPDWWLRSGLLMTLYVALRAEQIWEQQTLEPKPPYRDCLFHGAEGVPLYGQLAVPPHPRGTFVGTYGITGSLDNQWMLKILGRKAYAQGYAVVLFDWRGHGKSAELSPTLTSDGLYEGEDFVRIAAQAKALGCPAPFWLTGFSLGGQLALWGVKTAQSLLPQGDIALEPAAIAGAAVICPNLDACRSLPYLMQDPLGQFLDRAIARNLQKLAQELAQFHPDAFEPDAIARIKTIWDFDQALVIQRLGFSSVEDYYRASSPLPFLADLQKPTLILYAADDPLFDPTLVEDLKAISDRNPSLHLWLTRYGGHVGYISSAANQRDWGDRDPWWAWNRILDWVNQRTPAPSSSIKTIEKTL